MCVCVHVCVCEYTCVHTEIHILGTATSITHTNLHVQDMISVCGKIHVTFYLLRIKSALPIENVKEVLLKLFFSTTTKKTTPSPFSECFYYRSSGKCNAYVLPNTVWAINFTAGESERSLYKQGNLGSFLSDCKTD